MTEKPALKPPSVIWWENHRILGVVGLLGLIGALQAGVLWTVSGNLLATITGVLLAVGLEAVGLIWFRRWVKIKTESLAADHEAWKRELPGWLETTTPDEPEHIETS